MQNSENEPQSSIYDQLSKCMIFREQFAASVLDYSSKYNSSSSISYAPENLIGKPTKYPSYGDFPETYMLRSYGKWWNESEGSQPVYMSQDTEAVISEDYITLRFEFAVVPKQIIIYETYNPGAVVRLWGYTINNAWRLLWEGAPQLCARDSRTFSPPISLVNDLINVVRVEFNQSLLEYHTSLDAVLLAGYGPKTVLQANLLQKGFLLPVPAPESVTQQSIPQRDDHSDCDNEPNLFNLLPHELMVHILKYLDCKSLSRCAQVSRRFLGASLDPELYRELSLKRYWHMVNDKTVNHFMSRCKALKKLDLSWCGQNNTINELTFVRFLKKCCKVLTHLSVNHGHFFNRMSLEEVSYCADIVDLRLRNCLCNSWEFSCLSSLNKLVALDLYSTSIIDEALIKILKANPLLKHLILDFCEGLAYLDQVAETVAQYNKQLVTWSSWKTNSMSSEGVGHLSKCSGLHELDLGWCLILSDPNHCLERIASGCKGLRRLVLSGWRGLNDHLLLPIIRSCKQLTQLDLLGITNITGDICERILACLPQLQLLEISFCDSIRQEQVALLKQQYPHVIVQRSCQFVVTDYWH